MITPFTAGAAAVGADIDHGPSSTPGRDALVGRPISEVVDIAIGVDAALQLGDRWRDLEKRSASPAFFQSFAWCRTVMLEQSAADPSTFKPVIAVVRLGSKLLALWPLSIRQRYGISVFEPLGAPFDQYGEVLVDNDCDAAALVTLLTRALKTAGIADGLVVRKVRSNGTAISLAENGADIIETGDEAPQVRLDPSRPFDDFLATVDSKTRKNLRNYSNRLSRMGRLENRVLSGDDVAPAVEKTFRGRQRWLDEKGLSSSAFRDPNFERIVAKLSRDEAGDLGLVVFALMLDDRMIAAQWGFVKDDCYYAYLSARDPEFDAFSAGRIHLKAVIEACHERGIRHLDLMVPAVPYKMSWTNEADTLVDLVWPWTVRGWIVLDFVERRLRPALKRSVAGLPPGLRRLVFGAYSAIRRVI